MKYKLCDKNNDIVEIFYLDTKKLKLNGKKIRNIGQGIEGVAYRYDKSVLKLYKNRLLFLLKSKKYKIFQQIETKRILLPKYLILDSINLPVGYTTNYIEKKPTNIMRMNKENLINELKLIKEDVKILSKYGVLLEDTTQNNSIINGGIYFIDPGFYKIKQKHNLLEENYKRINWYIKYQLIEYLIFLEFEKKQNKKYSYYGDLVEYCLKDYKNINEFYEDATKNRIMKLR